MPITNYKSNDNYTARQLKLPLEIEKIIDISDPVYTPLANNGSAADNDITLIQDRCLSGCDGTLGFVEY